MWFTVWVDDKPSRLYVPRGTQLYEDLKANKDRRFSTQDRKEAKQCP